MYVVALLGGLDVRLVFPSWALSTVSSIRTVINLLFNLLDPPTSVAVKVMNPISKTEVTWIPPDHCRELAGYKVSATSTDGAEVWKGKVESTATNVLIGGLDPAVVMAGGYKFAVAAVDRTGGRTCVVLCTYS